MFVFSMTPETAQEFFRRCAEKKAVTEKERAMILYELASEGKMLSVAETKRTEEEYVTDLQKNFQIADLRNKKIGFDPEKTLDAVWCVDSETGEEVLMDRKTNQEIMRRERQ